jgi:hypothetical protein
MVKPFTTTGGSNGFGLTFLASFTTPDQSNSSIATLVDDYIALLGFNVTYLGRQDGSGTIGGDSITVSGAQSGTWTLSPRTTGDVGAFIAIHAGNGQNDELLRSIPEDYLALGALLTGTTFRISICSAHRLLQQLFLSRHPLRS